MQITARKEIERYYTALVNKDAGYIGIFFVGVKTTGIFCIPTCRARKPKLQNVEFYTNVKDLLKNGYRPCKICQPSFNAYPLPEGASKALDMLKRNPREKVNDMQLRKEGLNPENIRRWFKKYFNVTFHAYQRMLRINMAYSDLQNGNKVSASAFESGYDSLSGFGYTFKKITGNSPKESREAGLILMTRLTTPLGPMYAAATSEGVCLLEFTDRRMLETEINDIQKRLNARIITGENEHLQLLKKELEEYFSGKLKTFTVKLVTPGSSFRNSVWKILQSIPYGETITYRRQAELLKNPNAVRAVASANGHNRIAIIIPCHRVIGTNGSLTGYAGGLDRKKWLLEHELKYSNLPYEKK